MKYFNDFIFIKKKKKKSYRWRFRKFFSQRLGIPNNKFLFNYSKKNIYIIRNSQPHAKKQVMVYAMPPQQSWQLQHVTQGADRPSISTKHLQLMPDHSVGRTWNPPAVSGGALSASAWAPIDIGPQNTTLPPQPPAIRENTNTLFATQAKQSYTNPVRYLLHRPSKVKIKTYLCTWSTFTLKW